MSRFAPPPQPPRDSFLKAVMDASPTMMFVVDEDVRILDCNASALQLFSGGQPPFQRRGGDALQCLLASEQPEGCGHAAGCRDCAVRNAVTQAMAGEKTFRKRTVLELAAGESSIDFYALITAVPFDYDSRRLVLLTLEDISELAELWRIVPICSCCKKIRADDRSWVSLEEYFRSHWDLRFTHGYCPDCMGRQLSGRTGGAAT
ncbi:MAG: PAS domain-containing protein [Deltaproteobacteria bacterium]|nr:MAG: PAS domain-containing protein [Deltaproteobacteria bacterium]